MDGAWDGAAWQQANTLEIDTFQPESGSHRPRTQARLLHASDGVFGIFRVEDQYVRCRHTRDMDPVYQDSCVEFFVQPNRDRGYFNFEFNCGGSLLCYYVIDPTRVGGKLKHFTPLAERDIGQIDRYHSMPTFVDPEIAEPVEWVLEFFVPFTVLQRYVGPFDHGSGAEWRANMYKCADGSSHPHWASWSPIPGMNFHVPRSFGTVRFE
jgi:hypothetical protein